MQFEVEAKELELKRLLAEEEVDAKVANKVCLVRLVATGVSCLSPLPRSGALAPFFRTAATRVGFARVILLALERCDSMFQGCMCAGGWRRSRPQPGSGHDVIVTTGIKVSTIQRYGANAHTFCDR